MYLRRIALPVGLKLQTEAELRPEPDMCVEEDSRKLYLNYRSKRRRNFAGQMHTGDGNVGSEIVSKSFSNSELHRNANIELLAASPLPFNFPPRGALVLAWS